MSVSQWTHLGNAHRKISRIVLGQTAKSLGKSASAIFPPKNWVKVFRTRSRGAAKNTCKNSSCAIEERKEDRERLLSLPRARWYSAVYPNSRSLTDRGRWVKNTLLMSLSVFPFYRRAKIAGCRRDAHSKDVFSRLGRSRKTYGKSFYVNRTREIEKDESELFQALILLTREVWRTERSALICFGVTF